MLTITSRFRPPAWAQDAALALFVTALQVMGNSQAAQNQPVARPLVDLGHMGYVLLTLSGLALAVRRRWPLPVFLVIAAVSLAYYTAGYPDGPGWTALFIALYTLTAYGDGRRSLRLAAASITVLAVGWVLTANLQTFGAAGWMFFRIGASVMAAALGESVRANRVLALEGQRRAVRAELTREEEARRRVDAERLRVAREVHDTVAHAIAIINVQAGVTAHVLDKRPAQARETLVTIEQTSARALRELRATLGVLRDAGNGADEVTPDLSNVEELATVAREAGLDVKVEVSALPRELPTAVDRAAYRILQEAVTNVVRHAAATRVTISVTHRLGTLDLLVTDDGRGGPSGSRDGARESGGGQGIIGMRERAALLGGELTAGPRPGGGFEVRATLPLENGGTVRR